MSLLIADGVGKCFGLRWALRRVSLRLEQGEGVVVCGANGSGKSTLLGCLSGLLRVSEGRVTLGAASWGRERACLPQWRSIGVLMAQPFLYRFLSVEENLEFTARLAGVGRRKVEEHIAIFDLHPFLSRRLDECSLGVVQRLSLARVFIAEPSIVFLDEPLAHLDPLSRERFVNFCCGRRECGVTFLVTSHDIAEWERCATRSVELAEGRLVGNIACGVELDVFRTA